MQWIRVVIILIVWRIVIIESKKFIIGKYELRVVRKN